MLLRGYFANKTYKLKMWLDDPENKIWMTPFLAILLAIVLLITIWYVDTSVKIPHSISINVDTLNAILDIIASSMLAVATFSLGIMVSAFASVSSNITPRATVIVMSDKTTQKAISSFLASFLYAVIAKIALGQGIYTQGGIYLLFILTLLVLAYLVFTLISWVKTLSTLGRLNNTVKKIETISKEEIIKFWENPNFNLVEEPLTEHRYHILSSEIGYLSNIQFKELNNYCEDHHAKFDIIVRPGDFIGYGTILCYTNRYIENKADILNFFIIEATQKHNDNPNYGLLILSEIGQRALSPAVNDPGSAIYVLTVIANILNENKDIKPSNPTIEHKNLSIVPYDMNNFILPIHGPLLRDAQNNIEVLIHLQRLLATLQKNQNETLAKSAKAYAKISFEHGEKSLTQAEEKKRFTQIHETLFKASTHS
ncbi:MAG: Putative membrane protein [uncultured Sulfurovum sp.]|uniref:Membrane protein n=1 Tax=uncultured Sulfurovum sp. TaxID=269237 RepID=A0A6S6S6N8_9BACT|nr:MAG: Putative membrane protein [uncultured Sulfurovum sp.]